MTENVDVPFWATGNFQRKTAPHNGRTQHYRSGIHTQGPATTHLGSQEPSNDNNRKVRRPILGHRNLSKTMTEILKLRGTVGKHRHCIIERCKREPPTSAHRTAHCTASMRRPTTPTDTGARQQAPDDVLLKTAVPGWHQTRACGQPTQKPTQRA